MIYLNKIIIKKVCFSVSAGLICGKEGPLVHTGSILAAVFSHVPKVFLLFIFNKVFY